MEFEKILTKIENIESRLSIIKIIAKDDLIKDQIDMILEDIDELNYEISNYLSKIDDGKK
jgi:hypothetical protein